MEHDVGDLADLLQVYKDTLLPDGQPCRIIPRQDWATGQRFFILETQDLGAMGWTL